MAKKHKHTDLLRNSSDVDNSFFIAILDIPPSINHMYVNTYGGGKRLSKTAEQYFAKSKALIEEAITHQKWTYKYQSEWLYLDLDFYFPDRRKRDSHNCLKILLDLLEGSLFENDYYVMPRINLVEYDVDFPRVEMKMYRQTEEDRNKLAINLVRC